MTTERNKKMAIETNTRTLTASSRTKALVVSALILAMIVASLLAPSRAHASAFPGANGKIVFSSSRSTGTGVDNPEHDSEIFTTNRDGTGLKQLTKNNLNDFSPLTRQTARRSCFKATGRATSMSSL